jgi:hypothetical protein
MNYTPILNKDLFKIRSLLRRYHQDWDYDYQTWQEVFNEYIADSPIEDIKKAHEELNWLLAQNFSEEQLSQILFRELWCDYYPGDNITYTSWLFEIEEKLSDFLRKSVEVNTNQSVKDKKTKISSSQNGEKNSSKTSLSFFEAHPKIKLNEIFLYLFTGLWLYPVVGLGGCVTRIIIQGSPPHPYDSAHESWLNSPVKSWTTEAIYIPIAVIIACLLSHLFLHKYQDLVIVIVLLIFVIFGILYLSEGGEFGDFKFFDRSNSRQSSDNNSKRRKNSIRATVDTRNNSGLDIRVSKNLNSQSVIFAPEGSEVIILYYDDNLTKINGRKGRWCRVSYKGQEGWAWGVYLKIIED